MSPKCQKLTASPLLLALSHTPTGASTAKLGNCGDQPHVPVTHYGPGLQCVLA